MFDYLSLFRGWPPELATAAIATLPIAELRASIPIALGAYHLSVWSAFWWSVVGNMIPVFFVLWLLGPLDRWATAHSRALAKFFQWLFQRTRRNFTGKYQYYGTLALMIFVAIPLPLTGAWSGAIAAWLFGIPFKKALPAIFFGVLLAGIVVTLISSGSINFLNWLYLK